VPRSAQGVIVFIVLVCGYDVAVICLACRRIVGALLACQVVRPVQCTYIAEALGCVDARQVANCLVPSLQSSRNIEPGTL
jgi:hypothetical protein